MNSSPARRGFASRCAILAVALWALFALLGVLVVRNGEPPAARRDPALGRRSFHARRVVAHVVRLSRRARSGRDRAADRRVALSRLASANLLQHRDAPALLARRRLLSARLRPRAAARLGRQARNGVLISEFACRDRGGFLRPLGGDAVLVGAAVERRVGSPAPPLALLAVGICWSRLALGAHYMTDLVGGALLAAGSSHAGLGVVAGRVLFALRGARSPARQNRALDDVRRSGLDGGRAQARLRARRFRWTTASRSIAPRTSHARAARAHA